jgi:hypothetical protein
MDKHQIKQIQVSPLPLGSGGKNKTIQALHDTNTTLTMLQAQSNTDTKFDPPVPKHSTNQVIKEHFTDNDDISKIIAVIGLLLVAYGICAK